MLRQGLPHNAHHLMHDVKGFLEVSELQEHQRVAYEQAGSCSALATNRSVAQMTVRFKDIGNNVEANFSHQQRGTRSLPTLSHS